MQYRKLEDLDLKDKKVIMRADFNVPLDEDQRITDDGRIRKSLPTIKMILEKNASQLILMSHLGRPKGEKKPEFSLAPVAQRLSELLGQEVTKLDDCIDIKIPKNRVILLENLRFHKEEKENDSKFAKKLASYADIYINDAFGTCHRAHASVEAITRYLPSAAGLLVQKEIEVMGKTLSDPKRPYIAVLGGAKVSDKIMLIKNLLDKVDKLLIGGAMMFTFYKAEGLDVGKSRYEPDRIDEAKELLKNSKIVLPIDTVVANKISEDAETQVVPKEAILEDQIGLDIGPESVRLFSYLLDHAETVVWNGPMGVFEIEKFAQGTGQIAKKLAGINKTTIIGGGDSAAAIEKLGLADKVTHVSTGGGASLAFLQGETLPALAALEKNMDSFS